MSSESCISCRSGLERSSLRQFYKSDLRALLILLSIGYSKKVIQSFAVSVGLLTPRAVGSI